jgi:hypothetical protein
MAAALVPDALWSLIRPLLPASMPKPQGLRFWNDLLSAFMRLAARRNLGPDSLRVAELAFS